MTELEIETKPVSPTPPRLIYRGRNIVCRAQGVKPQKMYVFDAKNKFIITPDSFEDFYVLVAINDVVLVNDPMSKIVRGRPGVVTGINEAQQEKIIAAALEMEKSDRIADKKKFYQDKFKEKKETFGHLIAEGKASTFPDDMKAQCEEYAETETTKKYNGDGTIKVVLTKMRMLPGIVLN